MKWQKKVINTQLSYYLLRVQVHFLITPASLAQVKKFHCPTALQVPLVHYSETVFGCQESCKNAFRLKLELSFS